MPRQTPANPGIRDVAAMAGVSITTVSDSLSGKGRISEATRSRVREVARTLGYRPSALAKGLRAGRSQLLGLVVTKYGRTPWTFTGLPYFSKIVDTALATALEQGYALVVLPAGEHLESLLAYPLDGLFVVDPLHNDPVIADARRRGLPVIADRANATQPNHLWVDFDHDRAVTLMCDHLSAEGTRSPVLLAADGKDSYTRACIAAYSRWCKRANKTRSVITVGHEGGAPAESVRALMRAADRPDALFGLEDSHVQVLRAEAAAAGLCVPEDIGLGCFSEADAERSDPGAVTLLTVDPSTLAANAIKLLVDAIEGRKPSAGLRTVNCELANFDE
ncbi:LacI family DNA-binding transcriptional regulator [Saxibacter everestensis]|uniref:LacI family DNA-binding transcriptional regulator n=1 Tax=Saxibacter everestensis TaxID=2909229 RepID=A0ABY8QS69_9MICO|nr:LacI family DNA-binding transcriptional regulator [Brevibacteriaceae bacterium ZFBP1038]